MRVSVRERERERERGREREGGEGGREGAFHVLLIHSIFVVAFNIFLFFFFTLHTVFVFWIRYKIDVISSNAY